MMMHKICFKTNISLTDYIILDFSLVMDDSSWLIIEIYKEFSPIH